MRINPVVVFVWGSLAAIGDAITTWLALTRPGYHEMNPIGISVIGAWGLTPAVILRALFGISLFYVMVRLALINRQYTTIALSVIMVFVLFTTVVVAQNVFVLTRGV